MTSRYHEAHTHSLDDPNGFWAAAAERVHWYKTWDKALDDSNKPFYRWFTGGEVNTCYNALDRHVENGRAEQAALIYDSPVTKTIKVFSFRELRDEVANCAGALAALGVSKGDRVIIYMPTIPESVIAMLAVALAHRDVIDRAVWHDDGRDLEPLRERPEQQQYRLEEHQHRR